MIKSCILCHVAEDLQKGEVNMEKIQGYLPNGYALNPHAVSLIANKDVDGEYSYDKVKEVWFVKFPNTSLGLKTAARLYCGIIRNGYTIPPNDVLGKAILQHFEKGQFINLPKEIWSGAII